MEVKADEARHDDVISGVDDLIELELLGVSSDDTDSNYLITLNGDKTALIVAKFFVTRNYESVPE